MTNENTISALNAISLVIGHWTLYSSLHHLQEFSEQVVTVMRTGGGFGMILNSERWKSLVPNAFCRLVIQIDMSDLNVIGQTG